MPDSVDERRGLAWYWDEAYACLDPIAADAMAPEVRQFLIGMIAGTLHRVAENPQAAIDKWRAEHGKT